ncbi:c-type cytochrome [Ensifer sp. NPDC090286]|uniref:c-type cytochrome n=1 Tax=Ensifer sp. NPDC090286 TaxID=3363991 RepID=UPI00383A0579
MTTGLLTARTLKLAAVVTLLLWSPSIAADLARGRAIAARWCDECHVVAPRQVAGSDSVPPFSQIRKSERLDEARLRFFLSAPQHSRMPDLSLTRAEIADLVAYIKSQQR